MRKAIIDTDCGVDDALAIILALRSPEVKVELITTVSGNVDVERTTRNVLLVLEILRDEVGESIPPVSKGAGIPISPLGPIVKDASDVHGQDGLGGVSGIYPVPSIEPIGQDAITAMAELLDESPGELTIVTLGPLTNLALLRILRPTSFLKARELVIMGGAFRTYGNTTLLSEFNISFDPDAAAIVIASDIPKLIVPLDVTERVRLMRDEIAGARGKIPKFVSEVTSCYMDAHREKDGFDGCYLHDSIAVASLIDRSIFTTKRAKVYVETEGRLTRGMTIADLRRDFENEMNEICVSIDEKKFMEIFRERVLK